jgi:hypothetical protein
VDVQLKGPYAFWRHRHSFRLIPTGPRVVDEIEYAAPFSWMIGAGLVDRFFVRPELNRIFRHRGKALREALGLGEERAPAHVEHPFSIAHIFHTPYNSPSAPLSPQRPLTPNRLYP